MLSVKEVRDSLPPQFKGTATKQLTAKINNIASDPLVAKDIRENFVSYTSVLKEGRFKVEEYVNAVAFVSYKLMGHTNQESYARTFPKRYSGLVARGLDEKGISTYVAAYNRGKLVNLILEQTLVPSWVLNQEIYQKAINTQAHLMMTANSEKVRTDAANSLLTHLKKPENHKVELNLTAVENSGMIELNEMLGSLALRQQQLIGQGLTTREIAHQKLYPEAGSNGTIVDGSVNKDP